MLPRGKGGGQGPCKQLARLRQPGHGSNLHFPHMAQASTAPGFPQHLTKDESLPRGCSASTTTLVLAQIFDGREVLLQQKGEGMLLDLLVWY